MRRPDQSPRRTAAALVALCLIAGCGPGERPEGAAVAGGKTPPARDDRTAETADARAAAAPGTLNVVLITLDTTRADALGVYGQPRPTTPEIDRMAREGLRFAHVASAAPSTLPSHSTILTGKFPNAHGARSNYGYRLVDANESLAEVLEAHGYATAAEVAAPVVGRQTGLAQGFDSFRDTKSPGVRKKELHLLDGKVVVGPVGDHRVETQVIEERIAEDISDHGIDFIRANRGHPFFLWLHYFDPHVFHLPPPADWLKFQDDPYLGEVHYVDEQIGRVLDQLRGLGLADRTLVVLAADHGEGRGEHGEATHSYFLYETTIRVPLVMWGPERIGHGRTLEPLVRTVDIAPTILDLLSLPPLREAQGTSLVPLIDGRVDTLDLLAYGESIEISTFGASMLRFARLGRWKYIHKVAPELYDLESDPDELHNLADARLGTVVLLRERLAAEVESVTAPTGTQAEVDEEIRAQLQALGYLTAAPDPEQEARFDDLEVAGADPNTLLGEIETYTAALRDLKRGALAEAADGFRALWDRYRNPFFGLERATALIALERFGEAIRQFEAIIEVDPESTQALTQLGGLLIDEERLDEAERHLRTSFALDPCVPSTATLLSHVAYLQGRYRDQHEALRVAVESCDEVPDRINNYAYALATSPFGTLRDGARAVELASRADALAPRPNPSYRDTLAAAYAEMGDFARAVSTARGAARLASEMGAPEVASEIEAHLALFEAGRPLRDPSD